MKRLLITLFIVVMLGVCGYTVMHSLAMESLAFQKESANTDLGINRQRERKQQVEYDQAAALLPENEARVADIQPKADAAKAQETELRALRKQLRTEVAELETQAEEAETRAEEAESQASAAQTDYLQAVERAQALLQSQGEEDVP